MTGDHLEEGLARLARREEMLRRLGSTASGPPSWPLDLTDAADDAPAGRQYKAAHGLAAVDEITAAVGRVVERHPAVSVTLTVQDADGAWLVHVGWRDGSVRTSGAPAPAEPEAHATGAGSDNGQPAAARLAELLREDPDLFNR